MSEQLYLEIEILTSNNETEIFATVPSFIALLVYRYLDAPANVKLNFVRTKLAHNLGRLKLHSATLLPELTEEIICKDACKIEAIRDLRMPIYAIVLEESSTYIAGMCSVCRELVARQSNEKHHELLGFKRSCLAAPSEVSLWTRFCEVEMVQALALLLQQTKESAVCDEMPLVTSRFERHMNSPVRMHNIYHQARQQARDMHKTKHKKGKVWLDCSIPKEKLLIEHRFAEGISFTIADLILYPCMRLIFEICADMLQFFPLIGTWLHEIDSFEPKCKQLLLELHEPLHLKPIATKQMLKIPDCEASSLYKSDPKRYKPRNRIYTDQTEVDAALAKLLTLQLQISSAHAQLYNKQFIDWQSIEPEHAKSSALPVERLERKRQQLENVAAAVLSLAKAGERIVDFCSGTGHLGILLALQLPKCTIILMENKAQSLERAKQRAVALKLHNLRFYQCNIDYFTGKFDLGTSLHACGTATDIVLQHCQRSKAKFVCCPCCYGALQPMPHIEYPLSSRYRAVLSANDYLYLAHTADQAHELGTLNCKPEITKQGQLCMDIIDTDRKLQAEEMGYEVVLTRLQPEKCTPKNRLLVGQLALAASRR